MRSSLIRSFIAAAVFAAIVLGFPAVLCAQEVPPNNREEKPQDPPIPPARIPENPDSPTPPVGQPQPPPRASLNPDISVLGNSFGRFFSVKGDPDRNRPQLGELEIGLQQAIYPGIRFDAFLAAHLTEAPALEVEEAFATFTSLGGLPIGGALGQKRLNFGKVNPLHAHSRNYADSPAALLSFLGPEGLIGNGISANYTLPNTGSVFVNLEVGVFKNVVHEEHAEEESETLQARSPRISGLIKHKGRQAEPAHAEHGLGIVGSFPMARLWISKSNGAGGEVELGTSHGYGKGENGDNIHIQALDLTYRRFPGSFQRWMLQSELFRHRRTDSFGGTGSHSRQGHYIYLGYRPDRYYDYGIRYDNSRFPWPVDGSESSLSFIWTNRMSESALFRVQLKHGDRNGDSLLPAKTGYTEAWLQFVWGGGPHAPHPVQ